MFRFQDSSCFSWEDLKDEKDSKKMLQRLFCLGSHGGIDSGEWTMPQGGYPDRQVRLGKGYMIWGQRWVCYSVLYGEEEGSGSEEIS